MTFSILIGCQFSILIGCQFSLKKSFLENDKQGIGKTKQQGNKNG
jgi:hypothetical protein